jgi:hypothetical protein
MITRATWMTTLGLIVAACGTAGTDQNVYEIGQALSGPGGSATSDAGGSGTGGRRRRTDPLSSWPAALRRSLLRATVSVLEPWRMRLPRRPTMVQSNLLRTGLGLHRLGRLDL